MTELLASPAAARLGWVCVHSLCQAAAVAALAVALRLIPRQSAAALAARYRLAATALAALPAACRSASRQGAAANAVAGFRVVLSGVQGEPGRQ